MNTGLRRRHRFFFRSPRPPASISPLKSSGDYALRATNPVAIAGRCGVFAESDLIHKQQLGYRREDLVAGLCLALAKNYLTNVARNRKN